MNLVEEGIDVAIRIGALTDSSLIARKLAVHALPWLAPRPGTSPSTASPRRPRTSRRTTACIYSYLSTANVWRFTGPDGREIPVAVTGSTRINNGIIECEMVAAGQGILLTPTFYVAPSCGRPREAHPSALQAARARHPRGLSPAQPRAAQGPGLRRFPRARFGRRPW